MKAIQQELEFAQVDELSDYETVLASLPTTTEDYGCALNHLNNARNYSDQGEYGAASFELKLLLDKLKRI